VLLASWCFHLFVAAKSNFPNRNGCEVGALVFPDASIGYGSWVSVGIPQMLPLRRSIGIRVRAEDELGTDRNQRVLPPTHSSHCKRKAPKVPPVQQPEIGETQAEILALRHQLAVCGKNAPRRLPPCNFLDLLRAVFRSSK
jgi:hypothetical protein